jgi:hypothetical protein
MARPSLSDLSDLAPGPETCGEIDIRIARDGSWFYHGSPIGRKPLVKLFASALRRNSDGGYWLVTPTERVCIRVDDAPFVAVALDTEGAGKSARLTFTTNVEDRVTAGKDNPIRVSVDPKTGEPAPYVMVRQGLEALISRPVYYELVALGESHGGRFGVWSEGMFFVLGETPCES